CGDILAWASRFRFGRASDHAHIYVGRHSKLRRGPGASLGARRRSGSRTHRLPPALVVLARQAAVARPRATHRVRSREAMGLVRRIPRAQAVWGDKDERLDGVRYRPPRPGDLAMGPRGAGRGRGGRAPTLSPQRSDRPAAWSARPVGQSMAGAPNRDVVPG